MSPSFSFPLREFVTQRDTNWYLQAYLAKNDEKFAVPGWHLDKSWDMCTASWTLQIVVAIAITLAALCLPSEGGYELIPDRIDDEER